MILGIETSCDETAAALVTAEGRVLSNVVTSQIPIHARYGGVVPELASRNHLTAVRPAIARALTDAGATLNDVSAVAVTAGPGLAGCLLVGLQVAKALAWARDVPLVPVDHIQAHVWAPFLAIDDAGAGPGALKTPYLALAVSGGHTSLCVVRGPGVIETLGQTLDDAAGEAFDKVAKMMGLPYPGGVHIDRVARAGRADAVELPRPMWRRGLDFSFSGLKTASRRVIDGWTDAQRADDAVIADLSASVQEAIVDLLVDKALMAARQSGLKQVVIAGGVACNSRLRARMGAAAERAGIEAFVTPARYCADNAAMVAGLGAALLAQGHGLSGAERLALDIYTTKRPKRVA